VTPLLVLQNIQITGRLLKINRAQLKIKLQSKLVSNSWHCTSYSKDLPQLTVTLWFLLPQEEDSQDCCGVERGCVVTVRHLEKQIRSSAFPVLCHTYKGITLHFST